MRVSDLARDGSDTATARSNVRHGCRFRALPLYLVLALTSIAAFGADAFGAGPPMYTVYGPRSFVRSTGQPSPVSETFTVRSPGSTSTLRIVNHGITSAQVVVNGQVVFEPADFQGSDKIDSLPMERPVVLRSGANQLTVELRSGPGNHLTIEVVTTDVLAPRISAAANPPANAAGWNNADVTVTFTCADDESGIATCPAPVLVSAEGAQQIVSGTAVDKAGNTAVASLTVNLDKTAPVVTATVSPAANANGWNNGPVVVHFDCADGGSGVPACPADRTVTNDGAGQTVSETATDKAGNSASVTSAAFNIDRTRPAITVALTPAPGGWLKTPVTAHFTCNDAGSGVDTCPPDKTVASEGASQTVTGTVTDRAGNVASVTSDPFDIDVTPPAVTVTLGPPPNAAGWNNTEVTAHFTCADAGSGVVVCPDDQVISTEGAAQTVTGRAFDNAGNTVIGSATVNIDRTGPVLTLSSPTDGSTLFTATATVTGTVADTLSGVAAVTCNDAPATVTQGQVQCDVSLERGAHPILATATDIAGNKSTARLGLSYVRVPQVTISAPSNLDYVSMSPTTVTGTVDDPTATVTVNSIAAPVMNGAFSIVLPLAEGPNVITASANTAEGGVGTASVTVTLDTTPPHVTITSPPDQFVTTEASISIAGSVNDIVVGTVNDQQAQVKLEVSAREFVAQVSNRTFLATAVPLALGPNTILARAIDRVGNSADTHIIVTRRAPTQAQIKLISGNNQSGTIGAGVGAPLVVALTDAAGSPVANHQVIFKVTQNDGLVASGGPPAATVIATTDAQGQARAQWTLGHRAGAGGNAVEAYSVGFDGTALFTATGQQGAAGKIVVDTGNDQIGATGQPLPKPFIAVVVDDGNNRLSRVPVTFAVKQGGGSFDGNPTVTVETDSDGRAAATLTLGVQEGNANNVVEADFGFNEGFAAAFTASGRAPGDPTATTISGVVLDNSNVPIPGVTVRAVLTNVLHSNLTSVQSATAVQTNAEGQFSIPQAPVGFVKLLVDGSTASLPGKYPSLEYDVVTVAGQNNTVGQPIYLLALSAANQLCVTATTGGGTLTIPEAPGFSLTFGPDQVTFPGGSKSGCVSVTVVHGDKVPMVPGFGQQPRFIVTIQPSGAVFNPPAPITLPNVDGLRPREVTEMYSFDHDIGSFVAIGTGVVSDDGLLIRSSPGVGVLKAGWHCGGDPNTSGTAATCPTCQSCQGSGCQPDDGQSYDDGKFCTSCDGRSPGGDCCKNGSPTAIKIDEQDIGGATLQEWDFSKLADIIRTGTSVFEYTPGCQMPPVSIKGAIKLTGVKQCCEEKKDFETAYKMSGSIGVDAIGVECSVPGLSVDFLGLVKIGLVAGVSVGGEFSGSGISGGCSDCNWSVDGKIGVSVTGKAVFITKIDPSVIRFEGGVKGDGSVSASCNCQGCGNLKGCLGPVSVFGTVTLANFISKGGEVVIPGTQICTH